MQEHKAPDTFIVFNKTDTKKALSVIIGVSVVALVFLLWILFFSEDVEHSYTWVTKLPISNVIFNLLSSILLLLGLREIKHKNFARHMRFMIGTFIMSACFLVGYIIHVYFIGDTKFMGEGIIRPIYFFILISHIILSAFVLPLVLSSFYFALSGKFKIHRKVSKFTFPIWLYVSVTGVLIFTILRMFG